MNRDIASDLTPVVALSATVSTDTDTNGAGIDTSHYDSGVMFYLDVYPYVAGTFAVKLQDSPDNSVWTDVPTDKLILPTGSLPSISAQIAELDEIPSVGAFSTQKWVRMVVTSTSASGSNILRGIVIKKPENRPV
jgi:hypothetical protein